MAYLAAVLVQTLEARGRKRRVLTILGKIETCVNLGHAHDTAQLFRTEVAAAPSVSDTGGMYPQASLYWVEVRLRTFLKGDCVLRASQGCILRHSGARGETEKDEK